MVGLALVTLWACLTSSTAADWVTRVVERIGAERNKSWCVDAGARVQHLHILGVNSERVRLDKASQRALIDALLERMGSAHGLRVTDAGTFYYIPASITAGNTEARARLSRADKGAASADIVLLLQPVESGSGLALAARHWTNLNNEMTCNGVVRVPLAVGGAAATGQADPETTVRARSRNQIIIRRVE